MKSMARRLTGRPAVPGRCSPSRVLGTHVARGELSDTRDTPPSLRCKVPDRPTQRDVSFPTQRGAVSGAPAPCLLGTSSACPAPKPPGPLPWEGTLTFTEWRPWWRPWRGHLRGRQASGQQRTQADCGRGEWAAGPRSVRKDWSRGCARRPGPAREPGPSLPPRDAE